MVIHETEHSEDRTTIKCIHYNTKSKKGLHEVQNTFRQKQFDNTVGMCMYVCLYVHGYICGYIRYSREVDIEYKLSSSR